MANNGNGQKVQINRDAKDFAKLDWKKFKKENRDRYDSKKEIRYSYYMDLLDLFPGAIDFVVKYGYIKDPKVQETKAAIFNKLSDPDFVKILKKELKHGNKIKNIKLLPIVIKEILAEIKRVNEASLAANPNSQLYDMEDLVDLSQKILSKKMKKMEKAGISSSLAFDVLSIIPCEEVLGTSRFYRIHALYDCLYEHSKGAVVPFSEMMEILVSKDYYPVFITFALLERKEKFAKLTDNQKALYVNITSWCFDTMEGELSKEEIRSIINTYVKTRKRDEANGKDGNRRYSLQSLSDQDYERITKVIQAMVAADDSISKYL